jgi:hypothetical protein
VDDVSLAKYDGQTVYQIIYGAFIWHSMVTTQPPPFRQEESLIKTSTIANVP